MRRHISVSRAKETAQEAVGQVRRAAREVERRMPKDKQAQAAVQAAGAAVCASLALRLIRNTPIGALVVSWVPVAVFAGVFHYFAPPVRGTR